MTINSLANYKPISTDGKVLIDKEFFDELVENYVVSSIKAGIERGEQQIANGQYKPADVVFAELRKKYGYKV